MKRKKPKFKVGQVVVTKDFFLGRVRRTDKDGVWITSTKGFTYFYPDSIGVRSLTAREIGPRRKRNG